MYFVLHFFEFSLLNIKFGLEFVYFLLFSREIPLNFDLILDYCVELLFYYLDFCLYFDLALGLMFDGVTEFDVLVFIFLKLSIALINLPFKLFLLLFHFLVLF